MGLDYLPGCEFNTNEAIKQAVQAGLGLAVVSHQTIEIELETRRLVVLPVEGFPIVRRWYVVHRKDKRLSASATAFIEMLLAPGTPAVSRPRPVADRTRPVRRKKQEL
jgi:DNA-binding transcriptional LysR family regulator